MEVLRMVVDQHKPTCLCNACRDLKVAWSHKCARLCARLARLVERQLESGRRGTNPVSNQLLRWPPLAPNGRQPPAGYERWAKKDPRPRRWWYFD